MLYLIFAAIAVVVLGKLCARMEKKRRNVVWSQHADKANRDRIRAIATVDSLRSIAEHVGANADLTTLWLDKVFALPPGFTSLDLLMGPEALAERIEKRYNLRYKPLPTTV